MEKYYVESDFVFKGLRCVVLFQKSGHRCGYVGIPKDHKLYGLDYGQKSEYLKFEDVANETCEKISPISILSMAFENDEQRQTLSPDGYFNVHGGITYSGGNNDYPIEQSVDLWWFGFDCAHYMDRKDYDSIYKYELNDESTERLIEIEREFSFHSNETIRTQEYVEQECRNLTEQLLDI